MKLESIKSHLKPYSIFTKRATTVAHAFASAIAPTYEYDQQLAEEAIYALGQSDPNNLRCVYCSKPAETWDHLTSLVKEKQPHGFGHQIRNLVPCCKRCNSAKRGDSYPKYIDTLVALSKTERAQLKARLTRYLKKAKKIDSSKDTVATRELLAKYQKAQEKVLATFRAADRLAKEIREARKIEHA